MNQFWENSEKRVKVKICNIKSLETASIVSELGIDALGMHLWKTDNLEKKIIIYTQITQLIDANISKWLLTDLKNISIIEKIIEVVNIDTFQLQGEYSTKEIEDFRILINKKQRNIKIVKSISTESNNLDQVLSKQPPSNSQNATKKYHYKKSSQHCIHSREWHKSLSE